MHWSRNCKALVLVLIVAVPAVFLHGLRDCIYGTYVAPEDPAATGLSKLAVPPAKTTSDDQSGGDKEAGDDKAYIIHATKPSGVLNSTDMQAVPLFSVNALSTYEPIGNIQTINPSSQLSFAEGDLIEVLADEVHENWLPRGGEGWMLGRRIDGRQGFFLAKYAVKDKGAADVDRGEERIEAARLEVERADLEAVQQAEESESAAAAVNLRHKEEAIHVVAEAQSTGAAELDPEVSAHIVGQREYACIAPLRYV